MTRGLRIDTDGTVTEIDWTPDTSVAVLQGAVGGTFDCVGLADDLDMWVHDEGLYLCEPNLPATNFARAYLGTDESQVFHGPAVFTGGVDEEGESRSIGEAFIDMVNADRL